jgi:hypothetical protein
VKKSRLRGHDRTKGDERIPGVEGTRGAKRLPMSQPGVASAVRRGERMARAKAMQTE